MSLVELAPELVHHLYDSLNSIFDVLHLSSTCKRLHGLLPASQKLATLFHVAEQEFGPLQDIVQLLTHNTSQPVYVKRHPQQSYALLRQVIKVGRIAEQLAELYPLKRWQEDFLNRRDLTTRERLRIRRAVYRYWLYCDAFHNMNRTRSHRMLPHVIEERAQLLRTWTTDELLEVEDLRMILEDLVASELCPMDSVAAQHSHAKYNHFNDTSSTKHNSWDSWPPDCFAANHFISPLLHDHFEDKHETLGVSYLHDRSNDRRNSYADALSCSLNKITQVCWGVRHAEQNVRSRQSVHELRRFHMLGWGDQISQYYIVQSMLKLNPAQILHLYNVITTKVQLEFCVAEEFGPGGEEWFWNNGQTWLDTLNVVLTQRGEDAGLWRNKLLDGSCGIASDYDKEYEADRVEAWN